MENYIFDLPGYHDSHIYEFSDSPYPSSFYDTSIIFNSKKKNKSIGIIDQFQGKRPILLNREFVVEKKRLDLEIVQTLILDSHIVDYLHRFVTKRTPDENSREVAIAFLKHVSKHRCDYSPIFYLSENWAKSSIARYLATSSEKLASVLKLHSMNEDKFINDGVVEYKADAVEYYCSLYERATLDECGKAWAEHFTDSEQFSHFKELTEISYVCLLKMVLLHFVNPALNQDNILRKHDEFSSFLINDLNVVLGRELMLSLYYFSGLTGKFIGIQPNTSYEKAIRNLKSSAWDLLLLRMPEFLLSPRNMPEMNLAYIVTSEDRLFKLGKNFNIESLFYFNRDSHGEAILSCSMELFNGLLSNESMAFLESERINVLMQRRGAETGISKSKVSWLREDLELQLKNLCR